MKTFLIKHSPYSFFGRTLHHISSVEGKDCSDALIKFKQLSPEHEKAEVVGIKSNYSLRWKDNPSLISHQAIINTAVSRGLLPSDRRLSKSTSEAVR